MTPPYIPQLVKQQATYLRVPDYFWEGQFYLMLAETERADYWPTTFSEARLISERIIVMHQREGKVDWIISDFLTGTQLVNTSAKSTAWATITKLLQAPTASEVFASEVAINSRAYRRAFERVLDVFGSATSPLEQHAHVAAAHALLDGVVLIGEDYKQPPSTTKANQTTDHHGR